MRGTGELVLYLDYDGVLHHHEVWWHASTGPYLRAPEGYTLFQHSEVLEQLLGPYPQVQIVLSTTWVQRFGRAKAARELRPALRARVIGACRVELRGLGDAPRGVNVAADVERRRPRDWLALDDSNRGWPDWCRDRLILTPPEDGLSAPLVQAEFKKKLEEMCK